MRSSTSFSTPTRASIWNSCRKGIDKFNRQLYRIPGNGKRILLWEDKISGNPSLSSVILLEDIKDWLTNKGLLCLADFCTWDNAGNWAGWSFPKFLDHLSSQNNSLLSSLSSLAPVHCSYKDKWGWGQKWNLFCCSRLHRITNSSCL